MAGKTLLASADDALVEETKEEVQFFIKLDHPNCHYLLGAKTTLDNRGIMWLTEVWLTEVCDNGSLFDSYSKYR